jgi:electron transfer flavoprotein alpha subunit
MSVLVFLEYRGTDWNRLSFETITAGKQIAQALQVSVDAAVLGANAQEMAGEAAKYDLAKIYSVEHPLLAEYTSDGFTGAAEQVIRSAEPSVILFPHSYRARDFAPKLAARFGTFLVSDVVSVIPNSDDVTYVRQLFQGKLNADIRVPRDARVFASIQAGAFRSAEAGQRTAPVKEFSPVIEEGQIRIRTEEPFREAQRSVDLSKADIIVSVGRGIKEKENLGLVEQLAAALGAELAASRPICDNGWLPMERQVGSSGQTVAPKAYFAIGISGAIQHLVGMKGTKTVVAINKDENAPIFEVADYGIVGDLFEVVPALIEEVKKVKG